MYALVAPLVNFSILVGVLVYFLREPFRQFVVDRHRNMDETVKKVRQLLRDAQEQHDEFSAKLKAIDVEIAAMREAAKQDALSSKSKILGESQRLSALIVSDARVASENIFGDLRSKLRTEMVSRIFDRVEVLVKDRLTGDDRAKIRQEFSIQVESVQ